MSNGGNINLEIRDLDSADYEKAIQFAITGMHFDWYLNSRFLLKAYGRYFWYQKINCATEIIAAYAEGEFVGVLLAEIYGKKKTHQVWHEKVFVRFVDIIQNVFFKGGAGLYEDTVKEQFAHYRSNNKPDGEIIFLAADPAAKNRGIGSALLSELEKRIPGKTVYLHTDDACTYQFYERKGFDRVEDRSIILDLPKGKVPLRCFIYSKNIV